MAVFHDRFGAFREEVMELLKKKQVRQWMALCYLDNSFLHATHCSRMPCCFFTAQGSDGRSFQDEVVQHISEDLRVRSCTPTIGAVHAASYARVHITY